MRYANALIIAVLLVGSLVSAGAENSEPGDFIYPVKTEFNEPIRSALSRSLESKADWEAELAGRRIWEVETLALEKKLTRNHVASAIEALQTHLPASRAYIEELLSEGNAVTASRVASDIEAQMTTHARILLRIGASADTLPLLSAVTKEAREIASVRERAESEAIERPNIAEAAEGRILAAAENIREVKTELNRRSSRLSEGNRTFARERIAQAETLLRQAEAILESNLPAEAFRVAQSAYRRAEEAILLINSTVVLRNALDLQIATSTPSPAAENE